MKTDPNRLQALEYETAQIRLLQSMSRLDACTATLSGLASGLKSASLRTVLAEIVESGSLSEGEKT